MLSLRLTLVALLLLLTSCSNSGVDDAQGSDVSAVSTTTSSVDVSTSEVVSDDEDGSTTTESAEDIDEDDNPPPPVEAYDDNAEVTDAEVDPTSAWISRRTMDADSIEVVWSAPEGAATYQVHRVVSVDGSQPADSEMTAQNLITEGDETGTFVDDNVVPGERYWYGVRGVDASGTMLSAGWRRAAAVTDEQPPGQVELTVELDSGTVLLTWEEPEENYEMHGYRIFRAIGSEDPEVLASTWDLDRNSFVDREPPNEVLTYSIVAFDFHWNHSDRAEVVVDLS